MRTLFLAVIFLFSYVNAKEIQLSCKFDESKNYTTEGDKDEFVGDNNEEFILKRFDLIIDINRQKFSVYPKGLYSECGDLNGQKVVKVEPDEYILIFKCPNSKMVGSLSSVDELQRYYDAGKQFIKDKLKHGEYDYKKILAKYNIQSPEKFNQWFKLYSSEFVKTQNRNKKLGLNVFNTSAFSGIGYITVNRISGKIIESFEMPAIMSKGISIGNCEKTSIKKKF